jgi:nicotinamide-nucleotide adenylyltransferase
MKIGLVLGRFQPFHYGHRDLINKAFEYVDYLKIGIGSSNESGTKKNPFTIDERRSMINEAFRTIRTDNTKIYDIFDIPDINNPPKWPAHVQRIAGKFDIVFTGNLKYVAQVFLNSNISVDILIAKRTREISGTKIRKNMFSNKYFLDCPDGITYIIKQSKYYKKHVK